MTLNELKKKRGFTVESSFTENLRVQFKSSNLVLAREALELFKNLGVSLSFDDVNGGKAVGGYYASGFITSKQAIELELSIN